MSNKSSEKIAKENRGRVWVATANSFTSLFYSVFNMLMHFVIRKMFINTFGLELLGYNSTFTSLLELLNLAELGIGVAITYKLYEFRKTIR